MKIKEIERNEKILWQCLSGQEEWKDTLISYELKSCDGVTELIFTQSNWANNGDEFNRVQPIWDDILKRLKDFCENNIKNPRFI